jgi:hypothetical protein
MAQTTRGRQVPANQTVDDQADFFQSDGFTRVTGLTVSQLVMQLFLNNVTDGQITSGNVYWLEVPGSPGIYSVRFRPNALGYWRLLITYPVGMQIEGQDYDVVPPSPTVDQGLKASFLKPEC